MVKLLQFDSECLVGVAVDVLHPMGPFGSSQLTRGPCAAGGGCSGEMNVRVSPVQQRIRAGRCTTMTLGQRWGAL
ncbi:MAG TPA: hypothetical protein VN907_03045, partial [Actinomycetes bacterium]|nr:hypothetical protein [Actinomycetes bacterium]